MPTEQYLARIRRALLLDASAFVEARDDVQFTFFAAGAAAAAILIGAIGAFVWSQVILSGTPHRFFVDSVILGTIFLVILEALGIFVTYVLLSQVYREDVTLDGVIRVASVGYVPFALSFLVFIPGIGFAFGMFAIAAMFFYTIFGLRAAYPTVEPMRVFLSVVAGFAVWLMILPILISADNAFAPGTFVFDWSQDVAKDVLFGGSPTIGNVNTGHP